MSNPYNYPLTLISIPREVKIPMTFDIDWYWFCLLPSISKMKFKDFEKPITDSDTSSSATFDKTL